MTHPDTVKLAHTMGSQSVSVGSVKTRMTMRTRRRLGGHCQVERKYVHRLKVADYRSVIFGPQERASRPITPTRYFLQTAPILPRLDNALETLRLGYELPRRSPSTMEL
jgi:hypothetical protein